MRCEICKEPSDTTINDHPSCWKHVGEMFAKYRNEYKKINEGLYDEH